MSFTSHVLSDQLILERAFSLPGHTVYVNRIYIAKGFSQSTGCCSVSSSVKQPGIICAMSIWIDL